MAHFVGEHAFELIAIHHLEQTGGHGDRRVLGIASRGESVRAWVVDDVDLRYRYAVSDGERLDDVVQLLVLARVSLLGAGRGEHCRRTEVVREERGANAQQAEDDGPKNAPTAAIGEAADNKAGEQPDDQEQGDHDDAVALVAGDLVIHLGQ